MGGNMNFQFFVTIIKRIQDNYGADSYTSDQIKILYQEFGHVQAGKFSKAIDWLIMNDLQNKYPPNGAKIWGAIKTITKREAYEEDQRKMEEQKVKDPVSAEKISEFVKGLQGVLE